MHDSVAWLAQTTAARSAWHLVQRTLMLLPAGTVYCGTGKHHSVGKVQGVLSTILASADETGKRAGLLTGARTRLTAWVETQRLAAG